MNSTIVCGNTFPLLSNNDYVVPSFFVLINSNADMNIDASFSKLFFVPNFMYTSSFYGFHKELFNMFVMTYVRDVLFDVTLLDMFGECKKITYHPKHH